jgi:hypothetical protein
MSRKNIELVVVVVIVIIILIMSTKYHKYINVNTIK